MHTCVRGCVFGPGVTAGVERRSFRTNWGCVFVPHQVVDDHRDDLTNIADYGKVCGRYLGAHLHHKGGVSINAHIINPNFKRQMGIYVQKEKNIITFTLKLRKLMPIPRMQDSAITNTVRAVNWISANIFDSSIGTANIRGISASPFVYRTRP